MHEWWLYLVMAAFGTVIFDDQVSVLHRLHGTNVTAADVARHWPRRIADHFSRPKHLRLSATAAAFHDTFGCRLEPAMKGLVEQFLGLRGASWPARVRFALNCPVERQRAVDNLILRMVLTLGRI